jgi:hypothetical protein
LNVAGLLCVPTPGGKHPFSDFVFFAFLDFELQNSVVRRFNRLFVTGFEAFLDSLIGESGIIRFGNRVDVAVNGMIGEVIDFPSF